MDKPQLRILIVEDSVDDAELVVRLIKKGGYSVYHERVDTAQQTRDALKNNVWDIIISDYKMPGFSGIKALEILNECCLDIPFILVSGTIDEELAVEAMRKGANDYLMKDNLSRLVPVIDRELKECKIRVNERKTISQLEESEEKFRELFEMSPDSVVAVDLKGFVTSCNSASEKFTGYSKEETIGKHFTKLPFLKIRDIPTYIKMYSSLLRNKKPAYFETSLVSKDGTVRFVEVATGLIKKQNKIVGFQSVTRDITDKKKAEETLKESEEKYRLIVDNTSDLVLLIDLKGNFIFVSKGVEKYIGYKDYEAIGMNIKDFLSPKSYGEAIKRIRLWLTDMKDLPSYEVEIISKNNEFIPFELNTSPIIGDGKLESILIVARDIRERKRAEEKIKETLTIINRGNTVAFTWKNAEGWPVEFVSDNVEKLFGYAAEDFTSGRVPYTSCIHPDDLKRVAQEVEEFSNEKDKTEFTHEPYRIITNSGQIKYISDWSFIVRNSKGIITHYQGIIGDVTERKKSEKQLAENLEYFAHLIDHIRNPLAILSGFTQVEVENEKTKERLMRQIDRIEELIKQLDQGWMDTEETRRFLKRYL